MSFYQSETWRDVCRSYAASCTRESALIAADYIHDLGQSDRADFIRYMVRQKNPHRICGRAAKLLKANENEWHGHISKGMRLHYTLMRSGRFLITRGFLRSEYQDGFLGKTTILADHEAHAITEVAPLLKRLEPSVWFWVDRQFPVTVDSHPRARIHYLFVINPFSGVACELWNSIPEVPAPGLTEVREYHMSRYLRQQELSGFGARGSLVRSELYTKCVGYIESDDETDLYKTDARQKAGLYVLRYVNMWIAEEAARIDLSRHSAA